MKINKKIFSIVAILMILAFIGSIFANVGITNAQTTERKTYPFVDVVPGTVGVGQKVLINYGLLNFLSTAADGWNVTVEITSPSGKVDTLSGMTWSTGTRGDYYTPTEVGEYEVKCVFPGEYYNSATASYRGDYAASESDIVILTVQDNPVPIYQGFDLPGSYWTRPVDSQIRDWWSIMGSWVERPRNAYAPYNAAPESAHILWSMPVGDTMGGVAGGDQWELGYQNGDAYEGKFAGSVIISGVLYYNKYVSGDPIQKIVAVDLHTGKVLWEKSYNFGGSRINRGQILAWDSMNNRGVFSYIWLSGTVTGQGTVMYALDTLTGELRYNMTNVPGGTIFVGPNGEMLKYAITGTATTGYRLTQWNSSWVVQQGKTGMAESFGSQVRGTSYNATTRGYDLNVSIGNTAFIGAILTVFPCDRVIIGRNTVNNVTLSAISLEPGEEGRVLFSNVNWTAPSTWADLTVTGMQGGWMTYSQEDYVAILWTKEDRVHYAFSLQTGKYLWQTEPQIYADAWTDVPGQEKLIAYNRLYAAGVGGIVYCYNITDGKELWRYEAKDQFTEAYLSQNWWLVPVFISDYKIYLGHMEHSAQEPKPRGAPFFALNALEGTPVWQIDGAFRQTRWGGRALIGDSIIATMDTYDQRIYAIGKGPSSLTVTAPDVASAINSPVIIKGTIMDVSPGTESDDMKLRFPKGVPAVSDESMSEWMLYVYKQFPQPMAEGVTVTIATFDPNGNYYDLGTTKSDANGRFSFSFTPETEGEYQIYAIFDGTASYYGDAAQDTLVVSAAAPEPARVPYELYIIIMGIVAIVVNLIVVLIFCRKK